MLVIHGARTAINFIILGRTVIRFEGATDRVGHVYQTVLVMRRTSCGSVGHDIETEDISPGLSYTAGIFGAEVIDKPVPVILALVPGHGPVGGGTASAYRHCDPGSGGIVLNMGSLHDNCMGSTHDRLSAAVPEIRIYH